MKNLNVYHTPVSYKSYLTGYADGEGCFSVSINKSKRHKFGWELRPSFSVSQNIDRSEVLFLYQRILECGSIRKNSSDNTLKYEVRSLSELISKVIPHFEVYPLISSKLKDLIILKVFVYKCLKKNI